MCSRFAAKSDKSRWDGSSFLHTSQAVNCRATIIQPLRDKVSDRGNHRVRVTRCLVLGLLFCGRRNDSRDRRSVPWRQSRATIAGVDCDTTLRRNVAAEDCSAGYSEAWGCGIELLMDLRPESKIRRFSQFTQFKKVTVPNAGLSLCTGESATQYGTSRS
jgi:hypothetical protein